MTATTEFVVPRSMPMILPIQISSSLRCFQTLFSPLPLLKFSALLSSFFAVGLAQPPQELLIAAASDLIAVQAPLSNAWNALSDHRLRFTFGASGMLAQQVASGAPYDLFLSADEVRVKDLVNSGNLLRDSVVEYARGRLGLWSSGRGVAALGDRLALSGLPLGTAEPLAG